jgi:hypothetical protein
VHQEEKKEGREREVLDLWQGVVIDCWDFLSPSLNHSITKCPSILFFPFHAWSITHLPSILNRYSYGTLTDLPLKYSSNLNLVPILGVGGTLSL